MKNGNEIPLMLGMIQSQKWRICVSFFLCSFILPQQPDLFNHTPTEFSAVILGQATIDNVPAEEGDWVGVFDDSGNCAGAAEVELIDNRSVFILTAYGDDPATGETDEGLTGSEPFTLQIYDSSASVFLIHEGSYWGWQNTQGQFLDLFTPDSILNLVDSLRLNQLQVIGSHNSYHIAPYDTLLMVIDVIAPDLAWTIDYTHLTLEEQLLYYGIRQIELDIYRDPQGGLFANRLGNWLTGHYEDVHPDIPELYEPGIKILHFPDIDFDTRYLTFSYALEALKNWSDFYPRHVPVFVLIECKSAGLEDYFDDYPQMEDFIENIQNIDSTLSYVEPIPFDLAGLEEAEAEIRSVFGDSLLGIITPDMVRGNYGTLEEAVLDGAWPILGDARGKVLFGLDNGGSLMNDYMDGHPSLSGRILFVEANPGTPEAAFLGMNTPSDEIAERVSEGYLVRTRSDTDTEQARTGDTSRRDIALASGAHFISTDYYRPDPRHESDTTWTDYSVRLPGDYFARVNPVSGPQDISSLEFDLVNFNMIFDFETEYVGITLYYSEDWNLVGLPVEVEDPYYQTIFPTSVENTLYSFDVTYNLDSTLVPGEGYWLKFEEEGSTIVTGNIIDETTLTLDEGWNLVSGPGNIVSIYSVTDPDGIIIPGTLYGFEYNYVPSEEFIPGKSYWLKTFQAGEVTLTSGTVSQASHKNYNLKGKENTLTINGIELYFGIELTDRERMSYSLPPKPPVGAFDVRFTGDWKYCGDLGEIEVMNSSQHLTLSYDIIIPLETQYKWVLTSEESEEYILDGSGEIEVNSSDRFTLTKELISVPKTFSLYQNYPNPFNPSTTFQYDLPIRSHVTLVIYDILGEEVTQLVNTTQDAGSKTISWNSTNMYGKPVSAGVYLYQIKTGKFNRTRKMILLK